MIPVGVPLEPCAQVHELLRVVHTEAAGDVLNDTLS
jgi:hypothetical protein